MVATKEKTVAEELEIIRARNKEGLLIPAKVVAYAENPKTALHSKFQWDDTEAAQRWRIWQARQVIRIHVTIEEHTEKEVRTYVSLYSDRGHEHGGYRALVSVMNEKEQREELLDQAMIEARAWRRKYKELSELAAVFEEIDKLAV